MLSRSASKSERTTIRYVEDCDLVFNFIFGLMGGVF